jgi:tRNA threonylcarbamoyladenosine biosynthesis protein TsaB
LDASGATWSAALLRDGTCLGERHGGDSRTATAALPAEVRALLGGEPIGAVAVTVGPGSFTGLRGALAFAHGLALGGGVPVIGVTVAEALLEDGAKDWCGPVWVALDSRRPGRVFLGRAGGMEAVTLDALPVPSTPTLVLGDAAAPVCAVLRAVGADVREGPAQSVRAAAVGRVALRRLAGELAPCPPQPLYVEPPAARLP